MFKATNVFQRNYQSKKRIVINRGGTRSSKTYSLAQLFARWLYKGKLREGEEINEGIASIVRETLPALKATVLRDFEQILTDWGIFSEIKVNKTDKTYQFKNRTVEFFSLDDQQKVRGRKRDILWINEGNELDYDDFRQLNFRTSTVIFIDFNPSDPDTWINTELEQKRQYTENDVEIITSTFRDNPFLDASLVNEIEVLQNTDADFWRIFGEGDYAQIQGLVFQNWSIVKSMPISEFQKKHGYGLDFGFTNDPTALIEACVNNGEIWVNELIYDRGLTNDDISKQMFDNEIRKQSLISADSAEPKSIEELKRLKHYIQGVEKGSDSVRHSINALKQYKINITANSSNLISELKKYKWKHKDGKDLNEPIDKFNHAIDALRYWAIYNLPKAESRPQLRRFTV